MSFTRLEATDFVISSDAVTAPAWSSNVPTLDTFFKQNVSLYYTDVYNADPATIGSAIQFSVTYGHVNGTGSAPLNSLVPEITPTRITYGQYRNIVYGDNESRFNFGTGNTASLDVAIIQIDRNRYKESLMPGTFNLTITNGGATKYLTDNSNDSNVITYLDCGRVYDIVSGSNGSATTTAAPAGAAKSGYTSAGSYGLFLPDVGLIVLNPAALALNSAAGGIGVTWDTATGAGADPEDNYDIIFDAIDNGGSFTLNSKETISSNYVFVRVRNTDYNYSNNPSYITGSGNLVHSDFINNSQTYITTVGMYNDNNELLAVAKLSKPLVKDFTKECLLRVKLDW